MGSDYNNKTISKIFSESALAILVCFFVLITASADCASSLESEVPEIPSIFTLIANHFSSSSLALFLSEWEAVVFSVMIAIAISLLFFLTAKRPAMIPTPLQNFLELIIDYLRKFILDILGPQGEKYVPFLGTLFIYILTMNWVALVPFMKPPSSNLSVTLALAICVFCLVQYLNMKNYGFFGFIYHLAGSPKSTLEWILVPLMFPIELLTQITRPVTLALRLFGNVLGEDILVGAAALFGVYLLSSFDLAIGLPVQLPLMFLVLLTGLMQALVFTLLSTVYILLSSPDSKGEDKQHS